MLFRKLCNYLVVAGFFFNTVLKLASKIQCKKVRFQSCHVTQYETDGKLYTWFCSFTQVSASTDANAYGSWSIRYNLHGIHSAFREVGLDLTYMEKHTPDSLCSQHRCKLTLWESTENTRTAARSYDRVCEAWHKFNMIFIWYWDIRYWWTSNIL